MPVARVSLTSHTPHTYTHFSVNHRNFHETDIYFPITILCMPKICCSLCCDLWANLIVSNCIFHCWHCRRRLLVHRSFRLFCIGFCVFRLLGFVLMRDPARVHFAYYRKTVFHSVWCRWTNEHFTVMFRFFWGFDVGQNVRQRAKNLRHFVIRLLHWQQVVSPFERTSYHFENTSTVSVFTFLLQTSVCVRRWISSIQWIQLSRKSAFDRNFHCGG